jgi:hypothetical protein
MLIRMKTLCFLTAALVLLFCCSHSAAAQDKGPWRASSSEAKAITGDISISDARLFINFAGFTIAQIRTLTPAEAAAAFDADPSTPGGGNLYRLSIPADKHFQHKNTLCGSDETQWMATWASGAGIRVAFFSGPNIPVLTLEALNNSSNVCGNYSYVR